MDKRPRNTDYEFGYGRPPRSTQFKPGQSGNPRGRPPKNKDIQAILRDTLFSPMTVRENGRTRTLPKVEVFLMLLVKDALKGDAAAAARLLRLLPLAAKAQAEQVAAQQGVGDEATTSRHSEVEREMLQHFVAMVKDGAFDAEEDPDDE
jgi:hypothetical protein